MSLSLVSPPHFVTHGRALYDTAHLISDPSIKIEVDSTRNLSTKTWEYIVQFILSQNTHSLTEPRTLYSWGCRPDSEKEIEKEVFPIFEQATVKTIIVSKQVKPAASAKRAREDVAVGEHAEKAARTAREEEYRAPSPASVGSKDRRPMLAIEASPVAQDDAREDEALGTSRKPEAAMERT